MKTTVCLILILSMIFVFPGCGTFLYPERVGQPQTDYIDPVVLVLDGLLLFVGVIPGVVALVVDIHNNAIYLPPEMVGKSYGQPIGLNIGSPRPGMMRTQ